MIAWLQKHNDHALDHNRPGKNEKPQIVNERRQNANFSIPRIPGEEKKKKKETIGKNTTQSRDTVPTKGESN